MIEAKETLIGNISSKKTLTGKINNAIEKVYPELEDITITPSNKEQHFKSDKYGYGNITVESVSEEYIIPTGDLEINSNGTYDVKEKANAIVNVPEPTGTIDIDANGTYNVKEKEFANVNVPEKQLGTKVIDKNGIYNATDDNLDGYSSVDVQTSGADLNEYFETNYDSGNYYEFIKRVPNNITISGTSCASMFYYFQKLEEAPQLDTSNVTSMNYMFNYCQELKTIPKYNTSNVTDMSYMFGSCPKLQTIPQMDTSNVTNMSNIFSGCMLLEEIPVLNTSKVTNFSSAFSNCRKITAIPQLDTSNATTMSNMFNYCQELIAVPQLDASSATNVSYAFNVCNELTTLGGLKDLGKAYLTTRSANYTSYKLDLSRSTKLTYDSLMNVINNLYDIASIGVQPQQLVLGSTNLAKLEATEEGQQAILNAQNKGWSVS